MFTSLIHRLQNPMRPCAVQITGQCVRVTTTRLIQQLPALGNVLYMPMRPSSHQKLNMPTGFLVEALLLAPLIRTHCLMMATLITVDGPREWMECVDVDGEVCARMHLLPDTDYLAWDALTDGSEGMADIPAAVTRSERLPASAQMLRFHSSPLAGLHILGAELANSTSILSRDLAGRIARDEALPLQSAASG